MILQSLNNQKGTMSLVMTMGLVSISALVLFKMPEIFATMNQQRKHQRLSLVATKQLQEVSLMIKKSFTMGNLDPTCATQFDGNLFRPVQVNGNTFCMPRSGGLCSTDTETGEPLCVSTQITALNVQVDRRLNRSSSHQIPGSHSDDQEEGGSDRDPMPEYATSAGNSQTSGHRHTRIRVPAATDPLWRNCDGAGDICLRLVVCPLGQTSCNESNGDKFQVINLSSI